MSRALVGVKADASSLQTNARATGMLVGSFRLIADHGWGCRDAGATENL